ncbi:histone methyltransferase set2 [Gryganskiella cystojenkinii]|nr:histone methyltransferase set2 [Gryganskiella cystojenkinii]
MLPSPHKDDPGRDNDRMRQAVAAGSTDSSAGPSSAATSTSTSPSSSISDAIMTIEHAKETGFSSIIPELKKEEPEICTSLASLHASDPEMDLSSNSRAVALGSPKIEQMEKLEISSPIPLSRLFDFDQGDQGSDKIVLNESERQYQKKLREEFDAGFEDIHAADQGSLEGEYTTNRRDAVSNGHGYLGGKAYDSDDEEIRVNDDEEEGELRESKLQRPPPPPPPPAGPPSIKHLPSALDEAQSSYLQIQHNIYRGANTGNSPVDDCLPCQCKYNPHRDPRWKACGPDCINRNLLVECIEDDCPCGSYCLNRRFQTKQNSQVDVVRTEKKGFGLRAMEGLPSGTFVMEYIGEVLPHASFVKRTREYSLAGVEHFYFMSLQSDEVIDATKKGCLARFINHSCNPNCHLEKWVVGSKLRIGIFTIKRVAEGEELTFDYQFERYGAEAQKCYCGEPNCTGFIGGNKRSSATRLDNYNNLDEVEDEDEIDLENQISLRLPKKEKGNDGDYEDPYEQERITRGIDDPFLMEKLARIMFMKPKVQKSKRLLAKLMATTERACLRRFLVLHGLVILKAWLKHYKDEPDIITGIMYVLPNIPLLSRNAIEDSQIEEAVQEIAEGPECPSKDMAQAVLAQWKELKPSYRIPKAKKQPAATSTDAVSTPVDESSSFMSPSDSVGSGSAEGLGKRQYDDEDRSSTPAGMEKRSRFDVPPSQGPTDDNEVSTTPSEHASKYYGYDSPDYYGRSDAHRLSEPFSRSSEVYDREARDGRMDAYSRDGGYSRHAETGYGRTDSYGRGDPYAMSKSHYERGRYEHYRSDRDRERERYYDYYGDQDYDREYRSHRDPRDSRDREPRDRRDDRDLREYRDMRESGRYNRTPPSPRNRDRDVSPSASGRRDRSPSSSTRQSSWAGDRSRSVSPSKESSAIDTELNKVAAVLHDVNKALEVAATVTTDIPASTGEDASVGTGLLTVEKDSAMPSDAQDLSSQKSPVAIGDQQDGGEPPGEQRTPSLSLSAGQSTAAIDFHPRSNSSGGRDDYAQHRYGSHGSGGRDYSHSQYYRQSSSGYPHYSKPRHDYRSSSRSYPPPPAARPPPAAPAVLPPNWSSANDSEGRVYYYNEITRETQWTVPASDTVAAAAPASLLTASQTTGAAHYPPPRNAHLQQQQAVAVARVASPEPRKPVNIDGFTQEQIQEVIGRAYDKQKQKNLANGINSASASVHDVDSPHNRTATAHSPTNIRINGGKPLKPMGEKDLKNALSGSVVKNMAKYKIKLGSSEAFKKHARRITHLIADKEMRSKSFKSGELTELTPAIKNKIKRFVRDYMTKLFKKQPKEDRTTMSSSTAALVNGSRNSVSHVILTGADGVLPPNTVMTTSTPATTTITVTAKDATGSSSVSFSSLAQRPVPVPSSASSKSAGKVPAMDYGDVEVDDEEDVKYGEGDDDDEGDMDGEDDEDEDSGVAAVPSSSVELPL